MNPFSKAYSLWRGYALFVMDKVFFLVDEYRDLGVAVVAAIIFAPIAATFFGFPLWAARLIEAPIVLPFVWLVASMFYHTRKHG